MKVKDIMDSSPIVIKTSDTFEHLVKILDEVKYHVIFVVDAEDKLIGILTEGDILKVLTPEYVKVDESLIQVLDEEYFEEKCKKSKHLTVSDIMTKTEIFTIHENDTISKAIALMDVHRLNSLPVVRDSKVVGILPRFTLIKQITKVLTKNHT